jgi:hypothetical protein
LPTVQEGFGLVGGGGKDESAQKKSSGKEVRSSNEHLNKSTVEQMNESSKVQVNERSNEQDYRIIVRRTFDVFQDQAFLIDEWVLKLGRERQGRVTKGEVMREIIDFYFKKNKRK